MHDPLVEFVGSLRIARERRGSVAEADGGERRGRKDLPLWFGFDPRAKHAREAAVLAYARG